MGEADWMETVYQKTALKNGKEAVRVEISMEDSWVGRRTGALDSCLMKTMERGWLWVVQLNQACIVLDTSTFP